MKITKCQSIFHAKGHIPAKGKRRKDQGEVGLSFHLPEIINTSHVFRHGLMH